MSSFVEVMPPASVENKSSTLGSGYCSNFDALLVVNSVNEADLDYTSLMILNISSHRNSFSIISLIAYGNGQALQNLAVIDGSNVCESLLCQLYRHPTVLRIWIQRVVTMAVMNNLSRL